MKRALIAIALVVLTSCAGRRNASPETNPASSSASPTAAAQPMTAHGMAGWVGQEFSGRTTANGEIFDPMLMTAAHRTLPFGTLLDVRNPKTGQTVRVRVNDRGPYVGDRLIDLSYAAAQQIGLDESGGGEVDMTVVKVGRGDREPPAPFAVNVPQSTNVTAIPPAPTPAPVQPRPAPSPATVDSVQVTEQHGATVETRKQVADNGTSMVDVPVTSTPLPAPAPAPSSAHSTPAHTATPPSSKTPAPIKPTPQPVPQPKTQPTTTHVATTQPTTSSSSTTSSPGSAPRSGHFVVQVGAFSQEGNAKALQQKLQSIGQEATIDHTSLYFVRIGPFETREQAASVRAKLEAKGISAIITKQ